jgi:hypothetical protein
MAMNIHAIDLATSRTNQLFEHFSLNFDKYTLTQILGAVTAFAKETNHIEPKLLGSQVLWQKA